MVTEYLNIIYFIVVLMFSMVTVQNIFRHFVDFMHEKQRQKDESLPSKEVRGLPDVISESILFYILDTKFIKFYYKKIILYNCFVNVLYLKVKFVLIIAVVVPAKVGSDVVKRITDSRKQRYYLLK